MASITRSTGTAGIAVDPSGDLYVVSSGNNAITVLPASTGTLFGQAVTVGVTVSEVVIGETVWV